MEKQKFINRKKDIDYLIDCIQNMVDDNRIILLKGKSGIGKSAFTRKVLFDQYYRDCVKVRLEDGGARLPEGRCIEKLAQEIDRAAEFNNKLVSLSDFFNNSKGSRLKKRTFDIIKKAALKAVPGFGNLITTGTNLITKSGEFDSELFFNSSITEVILVLKSYIDYNLQNNKLVINIENIQIIDSTSLELIRQTIENNKSILYIFEYTTNSASKINEDTLRERLTIKNSSIEERELKKLSFEDYLQIINQKGLDKKSIDTILKYTYIKFDGDLRNLTDTEVILSFDQNITSILKAISEDNFNPRKSNIQSLNENERFVLSAIVAHNSEVSSEDILYINKAKEVRHLLIDIDTALTKLDQQQLVFKSGNSISIRHDSVSKEIQQAEEYVKYIFIAHKIWSDYYGKLLSEKNFSRHSKEIILYYLFQSLLNANPEKLIPILPEIKGIVVNAIRPDTAVDYLESLRKILDTHPKAQVAGLYYELLEIYYYSGIFDKAYDVLEMIDEESYRHAIFKAALLNRLDRHSEAIKFIKEKLKLSSHPRLELCLKLILFISYRSILDTKSCKDVFNELRVNPAYRDYQEYGYFLRNSEIILPLEQSIFYAQESVEFFKSLDSNIQVGHSKITLSMLYAWSGDLNEAMKELKDAERILAGKTLERHILFSNKAAISMYQGIFSDEVEDLLIEARTTALTPFEKLAIFINMLIFYTQRDETDKCELVIANLLSIIELENDKIMHRLTYYHVAMAYKKNMPPLYERYLIKTKSIHQSINKDEYDDYWSLRLQLTNEINDMSQHYVFLLKYNFEPCFISYWHFEIPKDF